MGCSQSTEQKPGGVAKKSAEKKEKVGSPLSANGHGWKTVSKNARAASLHDVNVVHHYHLKPPSDWREWSPTFSKRYEIKYEIGRGAYGSVWRAIHADAHHQAPTPTNNIHNAVAVKIVSKKDTDDLGWEMAHREMQVLKELSHPNIVPFRDSFECQNHVITVMDMCRGGELLCSVSEHVQIYTEQVVMRIIKNVLAGVTHMHSKGVCHRDLKPANLLLKKKLKAQEASCLEHIRHELEEKKEPDHHHHKPCFRSITSAGSTKDAASGHDQHSSSKTPAFKSITSVNSAAHGSMGEHLLSHGGRMGSLRDIASLSSLRESEIAEYTTEDVVSHLSSTICICDFGMAIKFKQDEKFESVEGLVGSPIYCSPELLQLMLQKRKGVMANVANQLTGCYEMAGGYDARCDIWSLGIISYILLSGYHPALEGKGGPTADLATVVKSIITEDFDFPADPWDKITQPAKDFVQACLVRDYTKRPTASSLQEHEWFTMSDSSSWKRLDRPSASIGHSQLDMKVNVLLKQDEPFGVELDEKTHQIKHVTVGSKADQLGLEEGMQLLEIKSKDRALSIQEIDTKDLEEMLHSKGGASLKLKGEKDCVIKPLRRLLEAENVDCNPPMCSNYPGLAALREVLQEREEAHWMANARAIEVDQETRRTSKEVLMTIESSLDPRDGRHETALSRLISDLRMNHPACTWVACHDSAAEMSDYINDLDNFQSYHIRFSLGSRGFLVVGTSGTKEKEQETSVHMNGKEVDGFRIEDTNLPREVIQQLYKGVMSLNSHIVEAQWIREFLSNAVPNKQWLVLVGTVLGESKTTSPSAPYLKFTFHHHKIHCFGFHQNLLRPFQTYQPYPPA